MRTLDASVFRKAVISGLMFGGLLVGTIFGQQTAPAKVPPTRDDLDSPLSSVRDLRESDNPLARQQWFMHGRTVEHGSASEYLYRAYQQKMMQRALRSMQTQTSGTMSPSITLSPNAATSVTWTNLGPAPLNSDYQGTGGQDYGLVGGRVTAVTIDQNDATGNTVYIGSAYGGVWKTTNGTAAPGAVNWTPITDDQATLAVNAVSVQPGNSNTILVGTGEPNAAVDSYYGLGVLRSTDGGLHWSLIGTTADGTKIGPSLTSRGLGITKFAWASPDNGALVVAGLSAADPAGSDQASLLGATNLGIIYSTDAGATWNKATFGIAANRVTDVVYNAAVHKFFAVMRGTGVIASSDGATWTKLAAQPGTQTSALYRGQITVVPGRNEMYIWYIDGNITDLGIYQSTDGGNTWNTISTGDLDNCNVAGTSGDECGVAQGFYNLYLAAIPSGSGTDLYAGAVNLFKCQISSANPDCSKNVAGANWLNLTHVYSCNPYSVNAHVHPDQHGIDFLRSNPSIIYFGNDGGLNRTLNGPGLNNGTCAGTPNPFDNLNANLGSTLQFYSLAGHPTDSTSLVGGMQDNGTAGVDSAHSGTNGTTWSEIQGGDGAAVAIDPTNGNNWYVSTTTGRIFFSSSGVTSRAAQFGFAIITRATVGNDSSDWVFPFKLDPADPTKMLIATCRIWRGGSNGNGWVAISNNFDGSTGACTSINSGDYGIIRSLAVGGPKTANGSQVIYAGTEFGHVWATTNADGGPSTWTDSVPSPMFICQTPSGTQFRCTQPVSGIAIDPRDSTGKTAYATVMGFGTGHVFKTTDGGHTWVNISGNLVDAPANAIVVDPGDPSILYVGNDLGVFASTDGGATWAEYGNLPNSAVFALDTFNSSSTHLLRAATHGRGVWSTTLASAVTSTISVTPSPSFLTFKNQAVGSVSATQTVTISVSGAAVTIGQASATAGFQIKNDACSNTTVQAGSTCTFGVAFAPTAAGVVTGTVQAPLSGVGLVSTGTINLEGNGVIVSGASVTPETGWYIPTPGTFNDIGFFIEYRPGTSTAQPCPGNVAGCPGLFVGGFLYTSAAGSSTTSNSTWLISLGTYGPAPGSFTSNSSGLTYTGKWLQVTNGQNLFGLGGGQQNVALAGDVTIVFPTSTTAVMTRPDGTVINLSRFQYGSTMNSEPGAPQNGWWASGSSTGYGIEIQGSAVFIVAYTYNSGAPVWYLTTSGLTTPTSYSGTWFQYAGTTHWCTSANPPCTAAPTGGATQVNSSAVPVSISFTDATHGTITMTPPGGGNPVVVPITKFTGF